MTSGNSNETVAPEKTLSEISEIPEPPRGSRPQIEFNFTPADLLLNILFPGWFLFEKLAEFFEIDVDITPYKRRFNQAILTGWAIVIAMIAAKFVIHLLASLIRGD